MGLNPKCYVFYFFNFINTEKQEEEDEFEEVEEADLFNFTTHFSSSFFLVVIKQKISFAVERERVSERDGGVKTLVQKYNDNFP